MKNFKCLALKNNIRVDIHNGNVVYKPCCDIKQFNNFNNLESYLQSKELHELKNSKVFPKNCNSCQIQESLNQTSLRMHFNNYFNIESENILKIEVMPNNTCNLKCFMCGPDNSSALSQEYLSLGWINKIDNTDISSHVRDLIKRIDTATCIDIIGGEFFLAKSNIEIMQAIIDKGIKEFRAVTNCTVVLDKHLELLSKFDKLKLQISLDGTEENYEFMRYPGKWKDVENNIQKIFKTIKRKNLIFQSVVQPLNLQHIADTLRKTNQYIIPHLLKNLVSPSWLSWTILTDSEKELLSKLNTDSLPKNQISELESIVKSMNATKFSEIDRKTFIKNISAILQKRQIDSMLISKQFGVLVDLNEQVQNRI